MSQTTQQWKSKSRILGGSAEALDSMHGASASCRVAPCRPPLLPRVPDFIASGLSVSSVGEEVLGCIARMERSTPWRTLKLGTGGPQLLVKTRADNEGYDIQLTDLSRVWGEKLDREAIAERAVQLRCSIEPGEQDQYDKFIEKIVDALDGKKGTTLGLKSSASGLSLQLSAPLPKPLSPFKWNIELSRLPDSSVAVELVSPLLRQANTLQHQIQQLVDELAAKDHVISKVTDRLEQSKIQLQEIFPTVSNIKLNTKSKRSQREQLSGHVKGLAAFDEDSWRDSTASAEVAEDLPADLLDIVLKYAPAHSTSDEKRHAETGEWWTSLDSIQASVSGSQSDPERYDAESKPMVSRSRSSKGNSGTQSLAKPRNRQATPSTDDEESKPEPEHPRAQGPTVQPSEADDTTEDEDDLDAVPTPKLSQSENNQNQKVAGASSEPVSKPKKLGAMGGKKASASGPILATATETSPESVPRNPSRLGAFGGKKKAKPPEPDRDSPSKEPQEKKSPLAKPKARLGTFGGKSKEVRHSSSPEPPATSSPKPKSKLGTFGGKPKKEDRARSLNDEGHADSPAQTPHSRSTSPSAEPHAERQSRPTEKQIVEQERENSEERADKKRERLKRELEEKSKVPAKKKRKF